MTYVVMTERKRAEIREANKAYLMLDDEQYDRHQELMGQKMTEWPDDLWHYVYLVQRKHGLCGEVLSAAVADWLRGTGAMTSLRPLYYREDEA